jgi:TonB-linked SusC/RagA family outer membrane protein
MKTKNHRKLLILLGLVFFIFFDGIAQSKKIEAVLIDQNGDPINEAHIFIKEDPRKSVLSDEYGNFTIEGEIGQHIEVITLQNQNETFKISEDTKIIKLNTEEEFIQLGYGVTAKKSELTSSIGKVNSDKLEKKFVFNPSNALFGSMPGLTVLENGGGNWRNGASLYIRGYETLGNGSILVLVDGLERPISSLSIHEISSIEILKDAASLAKFGLRGANGVLLVTTKRGSEPGHKISVSYDHGINKAFRLPEFLNGHGYASALNQARINDGLSPIYSSDELSLFKSENSPYLYPSVNWLNEAFRDFGNSNNFNISFEGNEKRIKYFAMLNYQTDNGLLEPVNENEGYNTQLTFKKFNLRTNLDINLTKSTLLQTNVGAFLRELRSPGNGQDNIMRALYTIPSAAFPIKTQNNIWGGSPIYEGNPIAQISATGYGVEYERELFIDARLKQGLGAFINGLSAEIAVAYDNSATYMEGKRKQFKYESINLIKDPETGEVVETSTDVFGSDTELSYYDYLGAAWMHATFETNLKYSKSFNSDELNSMLLFQQDYLSRGGHLNTFVRQLFLLNMQYSKLKKYFVDFSLAYNGTNMLPKGQKYGLFPALSFAWKLSNEDWFNNSKINELKIRSSWGLTGNDLIPQNIKNTNFVGSGVYYFNNNNTAMGGYQEGRLGTKNVTYESSMKTNLGIDTRLFNILELNLDIFYNNRTNILVESAGLISSVIGTSLPLSTQGRVENKGFELGLTINENKDFFKYEINGQVSFARNKILEMGESFMPYEYLKYTGNSIGQAFGWEKIGFFKDSQEISTSPNQLFSIVQPGDIKYMDQNDDGLINEYDRVKMGYSTTLPELYFSTAFNFEYKGLGIDGLIQGVGNYTRYLNTTSVFWPLIGNTTISTFSNNSWTPETANTAKLPRLTTVGNANNYRPNNIWLKDGSFLKLRSMGIYYNIPQQLISNFSVRNMQLYLRGYNLLSLDRIKYLDPESFGITYPTLTTYVFGIKIEF